MSQRYRRSTAPAKEEQRRKSSNRSGDDEGATATTREQQRLRESSNVRGAAATRERRRRTSSGIRRAAKKTKATTQAPQPESVSPNEGNREPFRPQAPRPHDLPGASFGRACVLAPTRSGDRGSTGGREFTLFVNLT